MIDRLASLAAIVGPDALSKQSFSNYDLPQMGYVGGLNNDEYFSENNLANLPKKFAYTPDDARFYLRADQFPPSPSNGGGDNQASYNNNANLNQEIADYFDRHVPQEENPKSDDHFYMKKDADAEKPADQGQHFVAQPSNVMSNLHSVDNIPHYARPIEDTSYATDIYYIGKMFIFFVSYYARKIFFVCNETRQMTMIKVHTNGSIVVNYCF